MNNKRMIFVVIVMLFVLLVGYFIFTSSFHKPKPKYAQEYDWTVIDEYYTPRDLVEDFIKQDAVTKNNLPVNIINYGDDQSILRRFRGKRFADPTEAQLRMMFNGLEDWKLVDILYKTEKEQEIQRTVLYVYINGEWSVGDSGELTK
jgi:hypothetical protein